MNGVDWIDEITDRRIVGHGPRRAAQVWLLRAHALLETEGLDYPTGREVENRLVTLLTCIASPPSDSTTVVEGLIQDLLSLTRLLPKRYVALTTDAAEATGPWPEPTMFELVHMAHRALVDWLESVCTLGHSGMWGVPVTEKATYEGEAQA